VLLYVNECAGTALPRYDCHCQRFRTESPHGSEEMQRDARLLLPDCVSVPVRAGDLVMFTPHTGSACAPDSKINRAVLFDVITLKPKQIKPERQYFCWAYMRDAFGYNYLPFRDCLRANIQHEPAEREECCEAELADLRDFIGIRINSSLASY
jgi:hypothetical protein